MITVHLERLPMHQSLALTFALFLGAPENGGYFKIHVVDSETGRGVPLVVLETVRQRVPT